MQIWGWVGRETAEFGLRWGVVAVFAFGFGGWFGKRYRAMRERVSALEERTAKIAGRDTIPGVTHHYDIKNIGTAYFSNDGEYRTPIEAEIVSPTPVDVILGEVSSGAPSATLNVDVAGGEMWRGEYARRHWENIKRTAGDAPYLRYVATLDNRTSPEHRRWHGTVLRWDHPWWRDRFPPNGPNCRCTVQQFSEEELGDFGYEISEGPPE